MLPCITDVLRIEVIIEGKNLFVTKSVSKLEIDTPLECSSGKNIALLKLIAELFLNMIRLSLHAQSYFNDLHVHFLS